MSTASTSLEVPTLEQLLLRIEETKPILTANVDETEANRRIAQANIDALTEAGVFKVTVPRRFGGYEMFIPMSELSIKETWFVAGMKGTGSNTIIADKVFVPEHRLHSVPQALQNEYATENTDEALYRSSFIPVLTLILAGPQLGLGRAALRSSCRPQCGNADRHRPPACLSGRRRHRRRRGGGREAQLSQPGTGAG